MTAPDENYRDSCRNCRFWRDEGMRPVPSLSDCRRYPPQRYVAIERPEDRGLVTYGLSFSLRSEQGNPETWPDFWCGEHQRIKVD